MFPHVGALLEGPRRISVVGVVPTPDNRLPLVNTRLVSCLSTAVSPRSVAPIVMDSGDSRNESSRNSCRSSTCNYRGLSGVGCASSIVMPPSGKWNGLRPTRTLEVMCWPSFALRCPGCAKCRPPRQRGSRAGYRVAPLVGQENLATILVRTCVKTRHHRPQSKKCVKASRKAHKYCLISLRCKPPQYHRVQLSTVYRLIPLSFHKHRAQSVCIDLPPIW
jgi:hypothetical protein